MKSLSLIKDKKGEIIKFFNNLENWIGFILIILMAFVPIIDLLLRNIFRTGIHGAEGYIAHLVLLITFIGGMITTRERQHLHINAFLHIIKGNLLEIVKSLNLFITVIISVIFFWSSLSYVFQAFPDDLNVGIIPIRWFGIMIPIGYFFMTLRYVFSKSLTDVDHSLEPIKFKKIIGISGIVIGCILSVSAIITILEFFEFKNLDILLSFSNWLNVLLIKLKKTIIFLLIIFALLGTPLYIILGGTAFLLFITSGGVLEVVPNEAYSLLTSSSIPAIPLFTLTGFILAMSKAGERLIDLFKSLFGWIPGGAVIVAVVVSAFFTTFTGASGVTILALGAILYSILVINGKYREDFTIGLLTASGSIGLLLPPSLPIILYGSMARINIIHVFIAGLLPGILLLIAMSLSGVYLSIRDRIPVEKFSLKNAIKNIKISFLEIMLPVLIVVLYFGGFVSLIESAAISVIYAVLVEIFIRKEIKIKDIPQVATKSILIIGGILIILASARALSYYIIDAEIPSAFTKWVYSHINSKYLFLLVLNLCLLLVGAFMDIYSAIMVVVPLILPLGAIYGIDPIHLGIIFLLNMELGFLTPPIGLNLFLASYCFNKPFLYVCRNVLLFLLIQLVILFMVTYIPDISLFLVKMLVK